MFISLLINNVNNLPGGGPLGYRSHDRSFEIGRENCDWTLPDPDKFISGRHCEIRYERGAFWLHDVSRNGTFVNGSTQRVAGPYRLGNGDRLRIGRYIVSVSIEDGRHEQAAPGSRESPETSRPPPPGSTSDHGDRQASQFAGSFVGSTQQRTRAGDSQGPERAASPFSFESDPFLTPAEFAAQKGGQQQRAPSRPSPMTPSPAAASDQAAEAGEVLRKIAIGAGIPPEVLLLRDSNDVALEIGSVLRTVVEGLASLLKARAAAKILAKSSHRTMISAVDNNPLKFVPGTEEILEIMFTRRRAGYLDAKHSVEDAFHDLKTHELATYAAMQAALSRLLDDLSPDAIEKKVPASSFASKKGRAWDAFVATWQAKEDAHENGMLDVFLAYFSEAYAKAAKQK